MSTYQWITFILGFPALLLGADYLIKGASDIALKLKMSPALVGFTIIAFGTSAPELLVSVQSARDGHPEMALGNVLGSNIANIMLVLGVMGLMHRVYLRGICKIKDITIFMSAMLLITITLLFPTYMRISALATLCLFGYVIYDSWVSIKTQSEDEFEQSNMSYPKALILVFVGFIGLIVGSDWLVNGGQELALLLGISPAVVGLVFFAVGTSLPEVAASAAAVRTGQHSMAIGNIMGSNIFNGLLVLPAAGLIQSFDIDSIIKMRDLPVFVLSSVMLVYLLLSGKVLNKWISLICLLGYGVWVYLIAITAGV